MAAGRSLFAQWRLVFCSAEVDQPGALLRPGHSCLHFHGNRSRSGTTCDDAAKVVTHLIRAAPYPVDNEFEDNFALRLDLDLGMEFVVGFGLFAHLNAAFPVVERACEA